MRTVITIFLSLLLLPLNAATYYVDPVSGVDSNDGISTGSPWMRAPGDSKATGVAASTVLQPGDIVDFKRGTTYILWPWSGTTDGIRITRSGTSGNPITWRTTWGSGDPVKFTTRYNALFAFFFTGVRNFNVFQGLNLDTIGGYAPPPVSLDPETVSVDPSTEVFTSSDPHEYVPGTRICFTSTNTPPSPITARTSTNSEQFYMVRTTPSSTTFTLSSDLIDTPMNVTSAGTGTHYAWTVYTPVTWAVDASTNVFTSSAPHGYSVGTDVLMSTTGTLPTTAAGTAMVGGASTEKFYIIKTVPSATTFTLTEQIAVSNPPVNGVTLDVTNTGTGTHYAWQPYGSDPSSTLDPLGNVDCPRPNSGAGFHFEANGTDNIIENCTFKDIGSWRTMAPFYGTTGVTGTGVVMENNKRIIIRGCSFENMQLAFSIKGVASGLGGIEDITLQNNLITGVINWGADVAPRSTGAYLRNILFTQCRFINFNKLDQNFWNLGMGRVGGFGDSPHRNGIIMRTSSIGNTTWTGVKVDRCIFYCDENSSGGTASVFITQGPSATVQNCVFSRDPQSNACINVGFSKAGGMVQELNFLGNTFNSSARSIKITVGSSNPDVVRIYNNIFVRSSYGALNMDPNYAGIGTVESDYNTFLTTPAHQTMQVTSGFAFKSLAQWQNDYGLDTHSIFGDPLFLSTIGLPSAWDLRVQAASPAIGNGTNLSAYFTNDYAGNTRTPPWDIGAYKFSTPVSTPQVSIVSPENGDEFLTSDTITFTGSSIDAEDGNISSGIVWSSSIDGPLGTGASIMASLSAGSHVISATSVDSSTNQGSAMIDIQVDSPAGPRSHKLNGRLIHPGH